MERIFNIRGLLGASMSDGCGEAHETITASALWRPVAAKRCGVRSFEMSRISRLQQVFRILEYQPQMP